MATDKELFIANWLEQNPNDDRADAVDAWKMEVKFINSYYDWDNQVKDD